MGSSADLQFHIAEDLGEPWVQEIIMAIESSRSLVAHYNRVLQILQNPVLPMKLFCACTKDSLCPQAAILQTSDFPPGNLLVVLATADTPVASAALNCLAVGINNMHLEKVSGLEPYVSQFTKWLALLCGPTPMLPSPTTVYVRMAAMSGSMPDRPLPSGTRLDVPRSRTDFEAMAWIEVLPGIDDDPEMKDEDLESRVARMRGIADGDRAWVLRHCPDHSDGSACDDEVVAMVCTFRETSSSIQIFMCGTLPQHQRQGYGSALLANVCKIFFARGKTVIPLMVFKDNHAALACYRAIGFECLGEHCTYKMIESSSA